MDEKLRDASASATHKYSHIRRILSLRKDVFFNIKAFSETKQADYLTHEERIYMQELLIFGKKMGLLLGKKDQQKLIKLDKKINKLERDFHTCLDEDRSYLFLKLMFKLLYFHYIIQICFIWYITTIFRFLENFHILL